MQSQERKLEAMKMAARDALEGSAPEEQTPNDLLHKIEDPLRRIQEQLDDAMERARTEWSRIPWYKKALINLFPSLYPEWY